VPKGSPFTVLCRLAAELSRPIVADLHAHTNLSDGSCTPGQLVALAKQAKLEHLAVTDHDTTAALAMARDAAASFPGRALRIVSGVEVSTQVDSREYHMLAYGFEESNGSFQTMLGGIRDRRRARFEEYRRNLPPFGDDIASAALGPAESYGRLHLAKALVLAGHAADRGMAFRHYLQPLKLPPSHAVPLEEAIATVRQAGGVAVLAHPPADTTFEFLQHWHSRGLHGVEVTHPGVPVAFRQQLRAWAREIGLAVSGGSDFHAPGGRAVGSAGTTSAELARLIG
jgi:3',5'-nucleoside bisphosphate phosphatase